jgi:predicted ATP-grasp superfamily ATP-dependent carboligase
MKILVTDGDTRAALAVTRALGRLGHAVHVGSPAPWSLAGTSRYALDEHPQAAAAEGPEALGRSLLRLVEEIRPDRVLGVTDRTLTALYALGAALPAGVLLPPSAKQYADASDKVRLFEICKDAGIRTPDGVVVDGTAPPTAGALEGLGTPVVVRPALSWRAEGGRWLQGPVTYEPDAAAVEARIRRDPVLSFPYLVQRRIEGEGCGLFIVADDGTIVRSFAHRRLREKPPSGGVSTLCESVVVPRDLLDAARRFAGALRWSGLAMLEFKRSRAGGEPYLLEVNARPWGSMELAIAAGVEFPDVLLATFAGTRIASDAGYRTGIRLRWWWGDVDHFYLHEKEAGRGGRASLLRAVGRALAAGPWPEAWDTFRRDDPVPFVFETLGWIRR